MQPRFILCFTFLLFAFNGCSSISVNHDYNPDYDFNRLKTYSWLDDNALGSSDTRLNNDLVRDRIGQAVETALNSKGYRLVTEEEASFLVTWHGIIDTKLKMDTIDHYYKPYGYGMRGGYHPLMNSQQVTVISEYEQGTLLIDILDPVQQTLIWRGTGQDVVHRNRKPEQVTDNINSAVHDILKKFPPTITK